MESRRSASAAGFADGGCAPVQAGETAPWLAAIVPPALNWPPRRQFRLGLARAARGRSLTVWAAQFKVKDCRDLCALVPAAARANAPGSLLG